MQKRKTISLALIAALIVTMFVGVSAEPVNAASKKYEVPDKVICYSNEATEDVDSIEKAVWKKADTSTYKYNKKGFCTAQGKVKTKWKLKGSKPVTSKTGSKKYGGIGKASYKKGKLKKISFTVYNKKGKSIGKVTEKYSTAKSSKGWIAKITGNKLGTKYSISYKYKFYSNGMPKTIKETEKAYGEKYVKTFSFNNKGLITKIKSKYESVTFQYKYSGDRVTERYIYADGFLMNKEVFVYSGKTTKNKKTYVGVMSNSCMDSFSAARDVLPQPYPWLAK